MANVKNYTEQGGEKTVIGGTLEINGTLKMNGATFGQAAAVADAAGEVPTAAEFKALLDSLRAAGILASS